MGNRCHIRWLLPTLLVGVVVLASRPAPLGAQFGGPRRIELSDSITVDEVPQAANRQLVRVDEYAADEQWDEAVETLRKVMAEFGDKLIEVPDKRSEQPSVVRKISVREYGQLRIAALPGEALELYRQRVDPQARRWYEQGAAQRDAALLSEVVERYFCSSWGDEALLALGEIALQRGDYAAARDDWMKILPLSSRGHFDEIRQEYFESVRDSPRLRPQDTELLARWYQLDETKQGGSVYRLRSEEPLPEATWHELVRLWVGEGYITTLIYPDSQIDPSAVLARLVLVSILEGDRARAARQLEAFTRRHPDATGPLGGRNVNYAQMLAALFRSSESWLPPPAPDDWPTFAGAASRNRRAADIQIDLAGQAWTPLPLSRVSLSGSNLAASFGIRQRRVAESSEGLLSYHPVVVGDLLLYCNQNQIFAFNLHTGEPYWETPPNRDPGEIFHPAPELNQPLPSPQQGYLGAPRFTLTVHGQKLFARMGSPITDPVRQFVRRPLKNYLVCLDLAAEGRQVWLRLPDEDDWAFEGTPVADDSNVYVGMRHGGVRAQAHVACFDAETGQMRWRRLICAADSPGSGQVDVCTSNLLTLHQGVLYYNTNLGGVTAISARDGRIRWLSLYQRARPSGFSHADSDADAAPAHYYRDLNPCVYHRGRLYVAPSDSDRILCLDALTGHAYWEAAQGKPAVHLLGAADDRLIASGDGIWWCSVVQRQGALVHEFLGQRRSAAGAYGRGLLAGGNVYWPTHERLFVFDQQSGQQVRQPIQLKELRNAGGGNLVVAGGYLLIAGPDKLYGFKFTSPREEAAAAATTSAPAGPR